MNFLFLALNLNKILLAPLNQADEDQLKLIAEIGPSTL
jgi:hypothetical protein